MSDPAPSRAWLYALPLLLAAVSCVYVLSRRPPRAAGVVEGQVTYVIRVDSEHGQLNGWFGPEIVYDVYLNTPDGRGFVLWTTDGTAFYGERRGEEFTVPAWHLRGRRVVAHVGRVDYSGHRPAAFALKVVAPE